MKKHVVWQRTIKRQELYKPAKRPDDEMREGGMKRMSTGDGMDTFKKPES